MYMMNKLFLVFSFLLLNAVAWSQGYLRLQIPVNNGELKILADQGVAVDHGIFKEEKYFISDFSYAWKALDDFVPIIQKQVSINPDTVLLLKTVFSKLASIMNVPLKRIIDLLKKYF